MGDTSSPKKPSLELLCSWSELPPSQRVLRFRFRSPSCHFRPGLPTVRVRSLADSRVRPNGGELAGKQDRSAHTKAKGSFRGSSSSRSILGQVVKIFFFELKNALLFCHHSLHVFF